jgi:hypothetical protein
VVEDGTVRCIRLEGRLSAEETGELEPLVGDDPSSVYLDLAGLDWADVSGLALLRRLRRQGFEMRGAPPHLTWRIEEDPS